MSQRKIILASGSLQRKNILSALDIVFDVVVADIDEKTIRDPSLKVQAEKIARAKAEYVARQQNAIIIAADTYATIGNVALEKPKDMNEAKEMLQRLSGSTGVTYTGFCYIDREYAIDFGTTTETKFTFRTMDAQEIDAYVTRLPVTIWSSAYSPAHPYGMTLLAFVNGSLTGNMGLPMELLIPLLQKSGVMIQPARI